MKKYEAHFKFRGEILNETLKRGVECKKIYKMFKFGAKKGKIVQFNHKKCPKWASFGNKMHKFDI